MPYLFAHVASFAARMVDIVSVTPKGTKKPVSDVKTIAAGDSAVVVFQTERRIYVEPCKYLNISIVRFEKFLILCMKQNQTPFVLILADLLVFSMMILCLLALFNLLKPMCVLMRTVPLAKHNLRNTFTNK